MYRVELGLGLGLSRPVIYRWRSAFVLCATLRLFQILHIGSIAKIPVLFTGQEEVIEISRVGSSQVRRSSKFSRAGSGRVTPTRPDPRRLTRPVSSAAQIRSAWGQVMYHTAHR